MDLPSRAARFAALGDPVRLALVDDLAASDRSPAELGERHGLASNLLAHHLGVLERAGLIERARSAGDGRRRYLRLRLEALPDLGIGVTVPAGPVLFVCTHNSARSQMAAAVWSQRFAVEAWSAGTHPAASVHPGAIAAAGRVGLDLSGARPQGMAEVPEAPALVVTVCDRAHEEVGGDPSWWHWSIPDPVEDPSPDAFDAALARVTARIDGLRTDGLRTDGLSERTER
ncbi:MAG: helix-turn-helix domain-containing protein [Actinobacteria bacterium]|nr:helix-turn-helix domain-containing protein [Actinomycetota bacterium]